MRYTVGRIDNRYLSLGTERPQATHHDLEEAIRAVLAGKLVPQPGGPPCWLFNCDFASMKNAFWVPWLILVAYSLCGPEHRAYLVAPDCSAGL